MFKGLRTRIESEQKGQPSTSSGKGFQVSTRPKTPQTSALTDQITTASSTHNELNIDSLNDDDLHIAKASSSSRGDESQLNSLPSELTSTTDTGKPASLTGRLDGLHLDERTDERYSTDDSIRVQILKLKKQLETVMRERDESNEQKAELNKIIEKLKRNLEAEHGTVSSLQERLQELELQLKEKNSLHDPSTNNSLGTSNTTTGTDVPNNIDDLRNETIELQAQLAKKNRQLRIRQQNLNDLKKTLQKEILEHSKTQKELARLQRQLHATDVDLQQSSYNRDTSASHNGSNQGAPSDTTNKTIAYHMANEEQATAVSSQIGEDTLSLNANVCFSGTLQSDRISCLSRSSASVDDFESNDLHQNNYNKEVSHEYLRNVLYRYMTSTDKETTQHLVKAISVLMDFSPEQSAAIKSAMNARSSWLRLK